MGWIEKKTKTGTVKLYRFTKTVGHKINSAGNEVPVKKEFTGRTKKEAESKYNEYMEMKNSGLVSGKQYFGVLADGWINEFFIPGNNIKDSTKSMYIRHWNKHIKTSYIYGMPLTDISAKTMQGLYNELKSNGVPASSIRKINNLMKRFYDYIEIESIGRNITRSLNIPKEAKQHKEKNILVWSDDEANKLLTGFNMADNRFRIRLFVVLAYYTGCRLGELLALTYDDISKDGIKINKTIGEKADHDIKGNVMIDKDGNMITKFDITDPKSFKSIRTIPLNPEVMKELKIHKAWHIKEQFETGYRTKYVFTTNSGKLYDEHNIRTALRRYCKAIGIEYKSPHTFRHTFGTNLCRKNVPIQTASSLLGHESIETTAKYYVNITEAEKQDAVNRLTIATKNRPCGRMFSAG